MKIGPRSTLHMICADPVISCGGFWNIMEVFSSAAYVLNRAFQNTNKWIYLEEFGWKVLTVDDFNWCDYEKWLKIN